MSRKVFINLPVKDLDKSKDFFGKLGFTFNAQFTDETAASMVVSEEIYVMLLTHPKFQQFIPGGIGDAKKTTEVLVCLSCESRAEVDDIMTKALAAGATTFKEPMEYGFMYGRSMQDLDGHVWEWMWIDPSAVKPN